MRKQKCAFFGNFEKVFVTHSFLAHIECARTRTLSLFIKQNHNTRNIKPNMGAKNFGRKKDSAKVKRAKRREKKLKALRFAGINVDAKEKDLENGETTTMTMENDETEASTTPSKREKRARDMRRKKELKLAMISMKEKRRKEEKKTSGTLRKTLSKNIQKMKKERDELVSKKKKDADESAFGTTSVGEMNDVEMMT